VVGQQFVDIPSGISIIESRQHGVGYHYPIAQAIELGYHCVKELIFYHVEHVECYQHVSWLSGVLRELLDERIKVKDGYGAMRHRDARTTSIVYGRGDGMVSYDVAYGQRLAIGDEIVYVAPRVELPMFRILSHDFIIWFRIELTHISLR
jgi:hypothetical protein